MINAAAARKLASAALYGGGGVSALGAGFYGVLVAEALAHGDMGLAVACLSAPSVATALAEYGSAGQQAAYRAIGVILIGTVFAPWFSWSDAAALNLF